ncbi:MAG: histidine kinase [Rubrivivax sp.]|nr:histidine kinase [Rubrivivax sp.]
MLLLCSAITGLLTVFYGGFYYKLIYSFSIGLCCWLIIDSPRQIFNWWAARRRARLNLASPGLPGLDFGWRAMVPLLIVGTLAGPTIGLAIGDLITGGRSPRLWELSSIAARVTLAITVVATMVSVFVFTAQERAAALRLRAEAAQRAASETQLRLLQSQLEPHMLFNTLANLRVLIGLDPPRAQAMLDRLISFLRATLTASRLNLHPLADEFARVDDYLALMAIRMGPRLQPVLDLPPALAQLPVPPLLLQPLVENSIKHGLEPQVAGGRLEVRARREGQTLVLQVRDTGLGLEAASAATAGTRFGLQQIRERLQTLYGTAARLQLETAPDDRGGALATITLPIALPIALPITEPT